MQSTATLPTVTELGTLSHSWQRHLRAANLSPKTISNYTEAARQFESFLVARGMPTDVHAITREHIEFFLIDVLERTSASSQATRYRQLQQSSAVFSTRARSRPHRWRVCVHLRSTRSRFRSSPGTTW
jgi:hypothetical protein